MATTVYEREIGVAGTHLYTWVERDNLGQSFLSKETTQWQGLGLEQPTLRSEVQCAIHYTTALPRRSKIKTTQNYILRNVAKQTIQSYHTAKAFHLNGNIQGFG